jgi:hypothetical protein
VVCISMQEASLQYLVQIQAASYPAVVGSPIGRCTIGPVLAAGGSHCKYEFVFNLFAWLNKKRTHCVWIYSITTQFEICEQFPSHTHCVFLSPSSTPSFRIGKWYPFNSLTYVLIELFNYLLWYCNFRLGMIKSRPKQSSSQ